MFSNVAEDDKRFRNSDTWTQVAENLP